MEVKKQMTNGELSAQLEAIKIIAENAASIEQIIKALERIQSKLNE